MNPVSNWLQRYAILAALATLALVGIGGVVTSRGVGMAVPDWPTSYGYNMFFFPISHWIGGIFYEHLHRLVASLVGVLVVGLARWLGGAPARGPLAAVGFAELLAGVCLPALGPSWKGSGFFLAGIGIVVLLAAAVGVKHQPAPRPLPLLGWLAFITVQVQGLLGGLRVVLFKDAIGIFHAALAQLFFVLLCVIALLTSRFWQIRAVSLVPRAPVFGWLVLATTALIFLQLVLGATMRHQHAGLAIPDFPSAYGKFWPDLDPAAITRYNQQRLETTALNPITAGQIGLQLGHRMLAALILGAVVACAAAARRQLGAKNPMAKLSLVWMGLIFGQCGLGAATIWTNKAADIATAHVLLGALSLATGAILSIICFRGPVVAQTSGASLAASISVVSTRFRARSSAAAGFE